MRRTRITRLSGLCLLAVSCSQPISSFTEADRAAVRDSVTVALNDFRRYAAAAEWDSLATLAVVTALIRTSFADSTGVLFGFNGAVSMVWSHEPEGWRVRSGHSSAPVPRGQ